MAFDYLSKFPLPVQVMPSKLKRLLEPVGLVPDDFIEVACRYELDPHGIQKEHLQLLMAIVPGCESDPIAVLSETRDGLVESSSLPR